MKGVQRESKEQLRIKIQSEREANRMKWVSTRIFFPSNSCKIFFADHPGAMPITTAQVCSDISFLIDSSSFT
ncbi:hypothetical protein CDL12_19394 [Handroanthus impetiginosus]|uniref:Uncharacterized protein n=1 Tax=Handroanthus impetiginosus TaxID=429701 RepID=A0A2G9GRX0_9LAMI|nr:hypothetical protein CDL12_19394 [Handroanthus impetiginosus]